MTSTPRTVKLSAENKRLVVDRIILRFLDRAGIQTTVQTTSNGLVLTLDLSGESELVTDQPNQHDRNLAALLRDNAQTST